jgi:flagellar biosynthesis/type III secretory pathway M-ring protein FliF/YscJ
LIVETLPFESTRNWQAPETPSLGGPQDTIPPPPWLQEYFKDEKMLLVVGAAALVFLLLVAAAGFVIIRKRRKTRKVKAVTTGKALPPGRQPELPAIEEGPGVETKMQERLAEQAALKSRLEEEALKSLKLGAVKTKKTEVLTKHLVEEAEKEPAAMAQLVRTWLNEEGD